MYSCILVLTFASPHCKHRDQDADCRSAVKFGCSAHFVNIIHQLETPARYQQANGKWPLMTSNCAINQCTLNYVYCRQGKRTNWETRSAQSGRKKRNAPHVCIKHITPAHNVFENSPRLETEPFLLQIRLYYIKMIIIWLSETAVVRMFNTKMFDIPCTQQNP